VGSSEQRQRLNTLSPVHQCKIEHFNKRIGEELSQGIDRLKHNNHHWQEKPMSQVMGYKKEHKAQWLAPVALAPDRFRESAALSLHQPQEHS
jgi:hypothetical protein